MELVLSLRDRLDGRSWLAWFTAWREAEADRFALWLVVLAGAGVLTYFSLRFEPPLWWGPAVAVPAILASILTRDLARVLILPIAAAALGFTSGQLATARAPPVEASLPSKATIVTGTVRAVDTLAEGRRIVIEGARLDGGEPLRRTVRIRLKHGDITPIATGDAVRVRALVRPPAWPAYPGGWDQQRDAYFSGLGASGYALNPAERVATGVPAAPLRFMQRLSEIIAARVTAIVPGPAGQICVALLTGTQTGIPAAELQAFRDSGLAHLLSVSGLHIAIVMGVFLAVSRFGLALSVHASLFWPTKQIAAVIALTAGGFYMVLAGMQPPVVRSFCMACLFTLAVFIGRNPISLRGLALAALVLILLSPQEVPRASFQMSFSAVLALISGYEVLQPWLRRLHGKTMGRRLLSHVVALALTSVLAGVASAPFGAYHFGRLQVYFVLSNMFAVPVTGFWVMPAGMMGLLLMPFGLEWLVLVPMGWGTSVVIWIANATAALPAATLPWPHTPVWGLAVLSFGLAWLGLWRTRVRLAGLAAILLGIASPWTTRPADILISADSRLLGYRTEAGVFVQKAQGGNNFVRDAWQKYWTVTSVSPMPKEGEAAGGAISCRGGMCLMHPHPGGASALLAQEGKRPESCRGAGLIVSLEPARGLCAKPWPQLADRFTTWKDGSVAVWLNGAEPIVRTDRQERGTRPWVPPVPVPNRKSAPGLPLAATDQPEPPPRTEPVE